MTSLDALEYINNIMQHFDRESVQSRLEYMAILDDIAKVLEEYEEDGIERSNY